MANLGREYCLLERRQNNWAETDKSHWIVGYKIADAMKGCKFSVV